MIGVSFFYVIPFIDVIRRSFTSAIQSSWVGFGNYLMVIENQAFVLALKNTLHFLGVSIPILVIISLLAAYYIKNYVKRGYLLKAIFLIPMAIPVSTIALLCRIIFDNDGALNQLLRIVNIASINWLDSNYTFGVLVFVYIWKNIGYSIILWSAALDNIPVEIYEMAELDGANTYIKLTKIVLPNMAMSLIIILLLSLLNAFKVFRESYLIAGNYPHESIYMSQNLFNNWFRELSVDKLSAGAVIIAVIFTVIIIILSKLWEAKVSLDENR